MGGEWSSVHVRDLIASKALLISDGYRMRNEELGESGIPFVRGGDIRDGWINTNTEDHIRPEFIERIRGKLTQPGDVAFITKGTVGRVGRLREDQPGVVFAPQVAYWRVLKRDILDPGFVYYLLRGPQFQAELNAVKTHGAMVADYVSLSQQYDFRLNLPDIDTQRAIGVILTAIDDKIELNRRTNDALNSLMMALFSSWFVDFEAVRAESQSHPSVGSDPPLNLPGMTAGFSNTHLPSGWQHRPLDQIASFKNGLPLQRYRPRSDEAGLPVVKIAQLRTGIPDSGEWASTSIDQEFILNDGDVIFSWSGSLAVVLWCGGRAALNQHLFKVTSSHYPKWLFLCWLYTHLPTFQRIAADKATTMGHIQRRHLSEALCVVPSGDVLDKTNAVMEPLLQHQIQNRLATRSLIELRDTLLPRLLSGELRIKDAERFVGQVT